LFFGLGPGILLPAGSGMVQSQETSRHEAEEGLLRTPVNPQ
jgi:hypothetical protein